MYTGVRLYTSRHCGFSPACAAEANARRPAVRRLAPSILVFTKRVHNTEYP